MKRLVVFRHAKSSWEDESLGDHDRPLAPRGRCDAPRMAARIVEHGLGDALVLSSSAVRARATASALADATGLAPEIDPRLYLATPGTILAIVAERRACESTVVVVAHNPGLTNLTNLLVPSLGLANLPTAGVAAIDLPIDDWMLIGTAVGRLEYLDYPRKQD